MLRRALTFLPSLPFLAAIVLALSIGGCSYSGRIDKNQKNISELKETVNLLKESVANYERAVKKMSADIEYLKKKVRSRKRR